MAAISERLAFLITANGSDAIAEFQKTGVAAETSMGRIDNSSQRLSTNLVRVGAGMAALGGVALVGLYKAAQAAEEEDLAVEALNNSIANSPMLAGASTAAFLDQAAALQDVTVASDDAVIGIQGILASSRLTQDEILGLTPLVVDLARRFGTDYVDAAKQVSKAMNGQSGALRRNNVFIDEAAFATDRYSAVMAALRENAGGFAEQEGQTFNGQIQILKNNLGDLEEGVGRGAVTAFNNLLGPVMAVSNEFESLSPGMQGAIGTTATYASVALVAVGSGLALYGSIMKSRAAYLMVKTAAAEAAVAEGAEAAAAGGSKLATVASTAAVLAAVVAYVAYARSLDGVKVDMEELSTATTAQMVDAAEAIAAFGDAPKVLEDLFDIDPAAAQRFVDAISRVADNDQARQTVADLQGQLDGLTHASELSALGLDENASSAEELAARMDSLGQSIDAYLNKVQGMEEAAASEAEAQQALFESLTENGNTFDVNTTAGRQNIGMRNAWVDAVAGQVQAAIDHAQATRNYDRGQRQANAAIRSGIGDLRRMRDAGLITAEQFQALKRDMENLPHNVNVDVTSNVRDTLAAFQALPAAIKYAADTATNNGQGTTGVMANEGTGRGVTESAAAPRRAPYRGSRNNVTPVLVVNG